MKWHEYPIKKISFEDKNYPPQLKEIKNSPKSLFYRGNMTQSLFEKSLAIIGTRRITRYGKMVVEKFLPLFVQEKITIISGFMYGVDTEAHQKCLEYGGKTVAVLGGGLNVIYPPENEKLYEKILETGGIIISEYEPDFKPQLWTFPQRNRIVAGLSSLGVLVIEAGEKSGALITVHLARQQGKKIFAVPGSIISSVSVGTNRLIQNHQAKMVLCPEDVMGKKVQTPTLFSLENLSVLEKRVFLALESEPLTADEIAKTIGQNIVETGKTLSLMSLKGLISEFAGKYYLNS
jgi:DNA processing protein